MARLLIDHAADKDRDLRRIVGFGDEPPAFRQVFGRYLHNSGSDQHSDVGPFLMDKAGKFNAVQPPWHMDVCEDRPYIGPAFQLDERMLGIISVHNLEACVFEGLYHIETHHRLVLDDKNDQAGVRW